MLSFRMMETAAPERFLKRAIGILSCGPANEVTEKRSAGSQKQPFFKKEH